MEEVKVCEYCEAVNKVDALECSNCGADLTFIIATTIDEEEEELINVDPIGIGNIIEGVKNDGISNQGDKGYNIIDPPVENKGEGLLLASVMKNEERNSFGTINTLCTVKFSSMKLINVQDSKVIEIPIEGGIVGREGNICPEYFKINPYLSCLHAKVYYRGLDLMVLDEGSTNGTKLNGMPIEKGVETKICLGDKIAFANWEFVIKS